ncbi:hypothetical protein AA0118_g4993 [Alternaria tenuissima]|nr:hypothetical protein AA0118_g4993 [Alternaria tenuissima]
MRWHLLVPLAAAATLAAGKVSTNARCGNAYNALLGGMSCTGSQWGNCCSQYGYCGKTKDYCGTGCQSSFGTCNGVVTSTRISTTSSRSIASSTRAVSPVAPSSTAVKVKVTTNARCGNLYGALPAGMTCSGGKYGDCCSQYSYCGSSSAYCGTGCQPGFGKCDAVPSSSVVSSSTLDSSSSLSSSSSRSASSSSLVLISTSSASESTTSTSSSESLSSDSSTVIPTPVTSSTSSEITVTSTSTTTASPSPTADQFCGIEGVDTVDLQVISGKPFTTLDACLADCQAQSACGSFIVYSNECYLARVPITSSNVNPQPNTGLKYYNRGCVASPLAATTPPSTLATSTVPTSTSTTSTSPSTVCIPPAPTVSCVAYPGCPKFTAGLANSCPSYGAQCQDNYFVRCENTPAPGSQTILELPNISVDECRQSQPSSSRLLNLPRELCDMIYEYALTEDQGLLLVERDDTQKSFKGCRPTDPSTESNCLKYVCRQLYYETKGLGLGLNDLTIRCRHEFREQIEDFITFLATCSVGQQQCIRKVTLCTSYVLFTGIENNNSELPFDNLLQMSVSHPHITFHLYLAYLTESSSGDMFIDDATFLTYAKHGNVKHPIVDKGLRRFCKEGHFFLPKVPNQIRVFPGAGPGLVHCPPRSIFTPGKWSERKVTVFQEEIEKWSREGI